jgi:hypothetical protein
MLVGVAAGGRVVLHTSSVSVHPIRARAILVFLAASLFACVDGPPVDPVVEYGDQPAYEPSGDPELAIGYYVEQLYRPLADGDPCPVVNGFQGGTWTMPALRMRGVGRIATVSCSFVTEIDEVIGDVEQEADFYLAPDGWIEIPAFPIPAKHYGDREQDPIDDLYGLDATLHCVVTDPSGREASRTAQCRVTEG